MSEMKTDEMKETFRKLVSEKLELNFVPRPNSSHFLVSVQTFPQRVVTDNELLPCIFNCFNSMGFKVDMSSIKPDDDFTWIEMRQGEEKFSVGITNAITPPLHIIITVTRLS